MLFLYDLSVLEVCCVLNSFVSIFFFFFKQKTAYEMRISDWSSDVCSSDLLAMAGEYNSAGTLTERYVHGPGSDEPLVWYHGSGTTDRRWLIPDERGSIIAATGSTGSPITTGIQTYDASGQPGSGAVGRFG